MRFPRQEYLSGLLFPSPGNLPDSGIEPASPALQTDASLLSHLGSPVRVNIALFHGKCWNLVQYVSLSTSTDFFYNCPYILHLQTLKILQQNVITFALNSYIVLRLNGRISKGSYIYQLFTFSSILPSFLKMQFPLMSRSFPLILCLTWCISLQSWKTFKAFPLGYVWRQLYFSVVLQLNFFF